MFIRYIGHHSELSTDSRKRRWNCTWRGVMSLSMRLAGVRLNSTDDIAIGIGIIDKVPAAGLHTLNEWCDVKVK